MSVVHSSWLHFYLVETVHRTPNTVILLMPCERYYHYCLVLASYQSGVTKSTLGQLVHC